MYCHHDRDNCSLTVLFLQLSLASRPSAASTWFEIWGSWIQVKKIPIFQGNFRKFSIYMGNFTKNRFSQAKISNDRFLVINSKMSVYRYKISHLQLRLGKKSPQPKIGRSRSLTSPGLTHATIIFISIDIVIVYQSCFVSDCRDVLVASVFVPSIVTVFYKSDARSCTSLSILYVAFASLKYLYRLLSN